MMSVPDEARRFAEEQGSDNESTYECECETSANVEAAKASHRAKVVHLRRRLNAQKQPDNLPLKVTFSTLNCNYITVIWTATFGKAQKTVRGIAVLGAVYDKKKKVWLIKSLDVEFNSLAYLLDIGGSYKLPGQP